MISKLINGIKEKEAPIVVGLDPMLSYIPEAILKKAFDEYGETPEGAAQAVLTFNKGLVDAVCDLVPAVKPQIAMYEQFGIPGLAAFRETVAYCKQNGLVVIGDVKRGDIGSTSAAYATAHLGRITIGSKTYVPFDEDFATVNPYLGSDGVKPFLEVCKSEDRGIFVLVKTSNPSSGELQDRKLYNKKGSPSGNVYEVMGAMCESWGEAVPGSKYGYSGVGAVVGATYPEQLAELRGKLPHTFFLVPGYGAQGGGGKGVAGAFDENGLGAIVNASRSIICAYKKEGCDEKEYAAAARREAIRMRDDICSYINLK